jgi:tetratricopeptide (TPR) repeat protein
LLTGLTLGLAWMNQRVRVERDQARASEDRAIDSRKLASRAIDTVVEKIGDNSLAQIPGMEEKRYEMLEQVIEEINHLLAQRPEDHAVKGDLVRTKLRLANIDKMKRMYAPAVEKYRSILRLIESVPPAYRNMDSEIRDEWDAYECDSSYYLCEVIHKIEGTQSALELNRKTARLAEAYMKRNRGVMPPTIAYARNQIQFADIQIDRGEIADAKAAGEKAIQSLESLVSVKRDASNAEIADDPTQQDMVAGLMFFTSALLLDGRCMTLERDFGGALKRFDEALRAAKRIQRFDNGLATGTNFLGRAYREMHLVCWKQGKTAEAASAYERAMQIVEKREDNPTTRFLDRLFVLIECDRARYTAKSASDTAREALQRAEHRFEETFAADPAKDWELMLYLATARFAVATADGNAETRSQAEREHAEARKKFTESKPNSPLLQELDLSSNQ